MGLEGDDRSIVVDPRSATAFVGRERELAELGASLAQALDGRGGVVLVSGEPGIGKSRLLEEVAEVGEANGARVVVGRCWEGGGAPAYWPWIQVLRQLRGDIDHSIVRTLSRDASAEPKATSESITPDGVRFCLFDSVTLAFERLAAATPLVVVLDDLHWSDASSLQLLRFVAESLPRARILVVGSYREFEAHSSTVGEILGDLVRLSVRIPLRGLDSDDVASYIEQAAGFAVRDSAVRAVHRATEGNPLFLREVVRLLIAEGRLSSSDDAGTDPKLGIPDEVRVLIRRRLGALSDDARVTLHAAAVVGREVPFAILERTSILEPARLLSVIEEAVAAGLIAPDRAATARYRFSHGVVRETIYDDLPAAARAELHARVGGALSDLHKVDVEPHLAELAHHFFESVPLGYADRALDYARRAGDQAMATFAYEDAAAYYGRALHALSLQSPDERSRCELLLALGEAQWRAASNERARESFTEAARLARKLADGELLARAALGYAGSDVQGFSTRHDETVIGLLEEALAALAPDDGLLRVRIIARLAVDLYWAGVDRRVELSDEALEMARRLDDPRAQLVALYSREWALLGPDTLKERLAAADEILTLARGLGDREMTYLGHQFRVTTLMELDDMAAVDTEIEICAALARELGMPLYRWQSEVFHAMRALVGGALIEAERVAQEAVRLGRHGSVTATAALSFGVQDFYLRWLQGRLEELAPAMKAFSDAYPWIPAWGAGLAFVYSELGRTAEARAQFAHLARDDFGALPKDAGWLTSLWALTTCACALGDVAHAGALYDLLLPYADRTIASGYILSFGSAHTPLGMLATTLERWNEAVQHFDEALRRNSKMGNKPMVALTYREHAAMLLRRGGPRDREHAAALLDRALALIDACELEGLRARTQDLRDEAETAEPAAARAPERDGDTFRREGEYWTIAYQGAVFRLKDIRGLHYIATLLANPNIELHAADVIAASGGTPSSVPLQEMRSAGLHTSRLDDADELIDAEAKAAYKQRLTDLQEDLEEAREWGDAGRVERTEAEIEALTAEIARAAGLRGRSRSMPSPGERARVSVTKAIRTALEKIGENSRPLAEHLAAAIRTGRLCSYSPGEQAPRWRT